MIEWKVARRYPNGITDTRWTFLVPGPARERLREIRAANKEWPHIAEQWVLLRTDTSEIRL